jgi:hypothetical protein
MITHQRQTGWTLNGKPLRNLCGPANAAYAIQAVTGRLLTPKQVAVETGNADNTFTNFGELQAILEHYNIKAPSVIYQRPATIDWHRAILAAGSVAITLVDYRKLTNKAPGFASYRYAHFVTPVRIEGDTVWLHDPLRVDGPTPEPLTSFIAAINARSLYRSWVDDEDHENDGYYADFENYANQALEVRNAAVAAPVSPLLTALKAVAADVKVTALKGALRAA